MREGYSPKGSLWIEICEVDLSVFFLPLQHCHCDEYVEEVLTVIIISK